MNNSFDRTKFLKDYTREWSEDNIRHSTDFKILTEALGLNEAEKDMRIAATGYASTALKSLIAINGGALISLPILVEFGFPREEVVFSALCFVLGLFWAMISILLAYFSAANAANAMSNEISNRYCKHMLAIHSLKDEEKLKQHFENQIVENKAFKYSVIFEVIAIVAFGLSLVSFAIGIVKPALQIL